LVSKNVMRFLAGRLLVAAATVTIAAGCAARSRPQTAADPARASELVRQGCYDCLLEARAITEKLPPSPATTVDLVEINLLLALREKELALDPAANLERAAQLLTQLRGGAGAKAVVDVIAALPEDATGRRVLPPAPAARAAFDATVAGLDATPFSTLFKTYLKLSVQCGRVPVEEPSAGAPAEAPLLVYRRAICEAPIRVAPLRAVRTDVPAAIETSLFLGRAAMATIGRNDAHQQRELFEEAFARFSESPSIAFNLATVYQATGDCRRAEELFSRTLTLRPLHEDARLGRVVCRTYISDSAGAIADATVLIDAAASNRADAYYWRAWNRRRNEQLDMARADIEGARALRINGNVLTLAGMIEHDQKDFQKAREDLSRAREMDNTQCQASWYLGLVGYALEEWPESAKGFAASADCYERLIATTEAQRAAVAGRTDLEESYRTRQLAGFDAAIKEDSTQKSAADLNAAINYARAGDVPNATVYMKRAAVDPERRLTVEDLRQVLGVPRW
jgi:tetratricopeptide (TPR) repeat protein